MKDFYKVNLISYTPYNFRTIQSKQYIGKRNQILSRSMRFHFLTLPYTDTCLLYLVTVISLLYDLPDHMFMFILEYFKNTSNPVSIFGYTSPIQNILYIFMK